MRSLLDVNFLVALLDLKHVRHAAANEWLAANQIDGWASCPLTENGCLRVITNRRYSSPQPPTTVLARLAETKGGGNHQFWPDDISITEASIFRWSHLQGHQQVTDIYLLALAVAHGGRLVTFDQGLRREAVAGCDEERLRVL